MEYCEVGDLSYHIKRKVKNSESFSEAEIFNWFIQICLALEYVHGRRIIHRDLKAQNIFLTGNNTIKLGDFGISRVLQNSTAMANTVVGTPYYMSPEACQSQPYTSKSDVWSLGIILYELCTLRHAFSADNLLGLVFKIVQEKPDPIPDMYSKDIQCLIDMLLEKDPLKRPSVREILKMQLIRDKAQEFQQQAASSL
jgi:NIMA (never in mitosis gene a)-related kinase